MTRFNCTVYDKKSKKNKTVGFMEFKNKTETSNAQFNIYGDIVSDQWSKWCDDDTCPQDVTDFLNQIEKSDDLDVHINSGGGSVFAGIAIYHQLKRHEGKVTVYIDGIAASIASVIACAGDEVIIPKASQFMIHKPYNGYLYTCMNADELRKDAETLDKCQESITIIYMENVKEGVTEETITELINQETWFTGNDITEYFNFKVEDSSEAVACSSDFFSKYKNTPKNLLSNNKSKENNNAPVNQIDAEAIANKVIDILDAREKAKEEKNKKDKEDLLEDLDQFGK